VSNISEKCPLPVKQAYLTLEPHNQFSPPVDIFQLSITWRHRRAANSAAPASPAATTSTEIELPNAILLFRARHLAESTRN
jgi:hypothetical protein